MTVGMLCLVLAGCKTGTAEQWVEREEQAIYANVEAHPAIIGRTSADPASIYKIMELVTPFQPREVGNGYGYLKSWGPGWPYSTNSTSMRIVVRPWGTGTEFRIWSDDPTPKFELQRTTGGWNEIVSHLQFNGDRAWMVYPPDPEGKYASKNWSVPEPGSPDLSLQ